MYSHREKHHSRCCWKRFVKLEGIGALFSREEQSHGNNFQHHEIIMDNKVTVSGIVTAAGGSPLADMVIKAADSNYRTSTSASIADASTGVLGVARIKEWSLSPVMGLLHISDGAGFGFSFRGSDFSGYVWPLCILSGTPRLHHT